MNQEDIREINLFELFFRILEKWRKMLGMALLFALLLGILKATLSFRILNDPELLAEHQQEALAKQKQYDDAKTYGELQIANLEKEIEKQTAYQKNSFLMQIDPYNEYQEMVSYFVDTDYQIMPGMTYQNLNRTPGVINAYVKSLDDNTVYENFLKERGLDAEPGTLRELVEIEQDNNNGTFTVMVKGSEQELAAGLMQALENHLKDRSEDIDASISKHKLTEINRQNGYTVDINLANRQSQVRDNLTKMQEAVVRKQTELLALKDPKAEGMTESSVVKDAVKYAILGGILGMFLAACIISVRFFTGSAIPGENDLKRMYGITRLGRFHKSAKTGMDRMIAGWEGFRKSEMDEKKAFELIAANIRNRIGEDKPALLVGSVSPQVLEKSYEELLSSGDLNKETLVLGGNLVEDPVVIRKLNEIRSVVFLEDRDRSSNADLAKAVSMVKQQGKEILGLIELS